VKRLAVVAVLVAGCAPAAAEYRVGKMASDPYIKVETSSTVEVAGEGAQSPEETSSPARAADGSTPSTGGAPSLPEPPRDLLAECRAVVADLLPKYPPAEGWADPVCHEPDLTIEAEFGRRLEGYALWTPKTIHLTPQTQQLDLRYLFLHETGHSWCANAGDYTEACADAWAAAA
jgi:hypothetical protein